MRLDDLRKEMPETPDFIHKMIQEEVEHQMQEQKMIPIQSKNKHRWKAGQVAAAAIACVIATSTVAYAGNKLYHMYLEKQGTYSVTTTVQSGENDSAVQLPDQVHQISIEANYIPEGMEWNDEAKVKLSYATTPWQGGISMDYVLLDEKNLKAAQVDKHVVESEEKMFGKYEGVYLRYQDLQKDQSFNQRIYLLCPEEYRVIILYIGDDVAKDEAVKFAENLTVTEKEEMIAVKDLYTWSEYVAPAPAETEQSDDEYVTEVADSKLPIYKVGESMKLDAFAEDADGNPVKNKRIMAKVDQVQIEDDLSLLEGKEIPKEWQLAVGNDGKLVKNHLSYIESGDGVENLDQVVKEEDVRQRLVYVTVTYKNTSDTELDNILYIGSLMLMNHKNGTYQVYDIEDQKGDGYDKVIGDSVAWNGNMTWFSQKDENGKNYIPSLKPGESTQVVMAWIMDEPDLENMYLNLDSGGGSYFIGTDELKTGLIAIGEAASEER